MITALSQVGPLAARSVRRTLRQPAEYLPAIIFPLVLTALFVGALRTSAKLPGFPSHSYFEFFLAALFVQGAITNGINSGGGLALDIQSGFLRRLGLTKVRPVALLLAQLSGALVIGLIQTAIFVGIGLAFRVDIHTGAAGIVVIFAFALMVNLAFAAMGTVIALRTGSAEVVQGIAPALTFLMLLSSYLTPRSLMEITWFRDVASANPISYLIEGIRSLIITDWNGVAIARFLGVAVGLTVLLVTIASGSFTRRMAMR